MHPRIQKIMETGKPVRTRLERDLPCPVCGKSSLGSEADIGEELVSYPHESQPATLRCKLCGHEWRGVVILCDFRGTHPHLALGGGESLLGFAPVDLFDFDEGGAHAVSQNP